MNIDKPRHIGRRPAIIQENQGLRSLALPPVSAFLNDFFERFAALRAKIE
jgi:hypothetical protein